jgi:hypothetical protein
MTTPLAITKRIQCAQCLAATDIPADADPHSVDFCGCCDGSQHPGMTHGQYAASCTGDEGAGHPGEPCSHQDPLACTRVSPPGEQCPGGHCGPGVAGCTVCRPLIHFHTTNIYLVS